MVFGQYKRANKQCIQSSKNIKKVDQEGTIEFRRIVKTQQVMRHTIKTARQDIMYKSKQAIISGAGCV